MSASLPVFRQPRSRPGRRLRLGATHRKVWLLVHIAAAGIWLGLDVVLAVLIFTALGTDDPGTVAFCFRALELVAIWPLVITAAASLVSGIVLGLATKYGLLRYWWVAVKLVANLVLSVLVVVSLRPGLHEAAEIGRRIAAGQALPELPAQLIFPPIVSTSALLFAAVLSVFKPWGRIRRQPPSADRTAAGTGARARTPETAPNDPVAV